MRRQHPWSLLRASAPIALLTIGGSCRTAIATAELPLRPDFVTEVAVGAERISMVWDTGTQCTVLASSVAERLRLPPVQPEHGMQIVDATHVARDVRQFVRVSDLRLGATDYSTFVAPTLAPGPQFPADGLLGMDLLLAAAWIVDVADGRLWMVDGDRLDAEVSAAGYAVRVRVPLRIEHGRPFVRVRLEDRLDVELLLDTGSRSTCLPKAVIDALALPSGEALVAPKQRQDVEDLRTAFDRMGVRVEGLKVEAGGAIGVHGVEVESLPFHLRRLRIGEVLVTDVCIYSKASDGAQLGADVLGQIPWAVHWQRGELHLLARRHPRSPSSTQSGM